jgi:hypothetical protein
MSKQTYILPCGNSISSDGVVTSRLGRVLAVQKSNVGYFRVELWDNGRGKKHSIHRLLAEAFIPNPDNKPHVNHIDGDKANNALSNLEWVTQSENQKHAYKLGLQKGYHVAGRKISDAHKAALCGSRWRGAHRQYVCDGMEFRTPEEAASHFKISRQTVYNRVASPRFPTWEIKIWQEVK